MKNVLWNPSVDRIEKSSMKKFMDSFNNIDNYSQLHSLSIKNSSHFWKKLISFFELDYEGQIDPICLDYSFKSYGWLPNMQMNFAQNLLKKGKDRDIALTSICENGQRKTTTYRELKSITANLAAALRPIITTDDVVACYMPNIAQTVVSMLATSSLGATFTSTSCDFGIEGVVDRFSQSKPKVMICVCGYLYNGKYISLIDRLVEIEKKLPFLEQIIIVDFLQINDTRKEDITKVSKAVWWNNFIDLNVTELTFKMMPANTPLYIMYSSGTTGEPKCIVHSQGGTLLQHIKELGLHCDLNAQKKIMYFTTCGWMMWNWLVSSLYFGSNLYLYEGSPGFPSIIDFFSIIDREEINIYGTSPKFLKALEDQHYVNNFTLKSLETILCTGAPLLEEQFDFVYKNIKKDLMLASIAGGTDIIGCFMLGNPILPVCAGQIQCLGLGMAVSVFDESGEQVFNQEGELVCTKSFPSRPLYFLNDSGDEKLNKAYFNKFEDTWHHGDFITVTEQEGVIIHGRSDATLNPGGVRIGTAEIYRQTERIEFIEDSICVGKQVDGDVNVLLFVMLKDNLVLNEQMIKLIKNMIRKNTTPRHVPHFVSQVTEIPYTRSGKKMELVISRIISGKEISNLEAIANADSLNQYKKLI